MWSDAAIVDQSDLCGTNPDPSLGGRAADWIDFLTTNPALDASEPVSVDLGGTVTGQQVELAVSPSWTHRLPRTIGGLLRDAPDPGARWQPRSTTGCHRLSAC